MIYLWKPATRKQGMDYTACHRYQRNEPKRRAPWSCGLMLHVLEREVGGSDRSESVFFSLKDFSGVFNLLGKF